MVSGRLILLFALSHAAVAQHFCCLYLQLSFAHHGSGPLAMCNDDGCSTSGLTRLPLAGFYMVETCDACVGTWGSDAGGVGGVVARASGAEPGATTNTYSSYSTDDTTLPYCCTDFAAGVGFTSFIDVGGCSPNGTCMDPRGGNGVCTFAGFSVNATECTPPVAPNQEDEPYCCIYTTNNFQAKAIPSYGGCPYTSAVALQCGGIGHNLTCRLDGFYPLSEGQSCQPETPKCSLYNGNCTACSDLVGCGYCFDDQTCRPGNTTNPSNSTCSTWAWGLYACPAGPCIVYLTDEPCTACTSQPNCGYCSVPEKIGIAGSIQCLYGSASGPSYAVCDPAQTDSPTPYNSWFFGTPAICPETVCPERAPNCSLCIGDGMCSACGLPNGLGCQPAGVNCSGAVATTQGECQATEACGALSCGDCVGNSACGWCASSGVCYYVGTANSACALTSDAAVCTGALPPGVAPGTPTKRPWEVPVIISVGVVVGLGVGFVAFRAWRKRRVAALEERQPLVPARF